MRIRGRPALYILMQNVENLFECDSNISSLFVGFWASANLLKIIWP